MIKINKSEITTSPYSIDYEDITPKNGVGISWEYFEEYINKHQVKPQKGK